MADIPSNMHEWSTTAGNNTPAGGTSIGPGLDDNLREIQAVSRAENIKHILGQRPGGRLTLVTAAPVTSVDVTGAETIYYTPYVGNTIGLYTSSAWRQYTFTELTLDVPDVAGMHDVFIYDNSGTLTLEALVWTNDTTRATGVVFQDGIRVRSGATNKRYLGSFYSTTAGNGQTEDSKENRFLWNHYNRVLRRMQAARETANTWSYSTATIRQSNANTANQLNFCIGLSEDMISAWCKSIMGSNTAGQGGYCGIGLDSTSTFTESGTSNGGVFGYGANSLADQWTELNGFWSGLPTSNGKHFLSWNERSSGTGTQTWIGDNNTPTYVQAGIHGEIWA